MEPVIAWPADGCLTGVAVELWEDEAPVGFLRDWGEASMAGKDKGGRSSKTPATKTAKEKRKSKKDKKAGKGTIPS